MDPKPPPERKPKTWSPLPEYQENKYIEHALVDQKSIGSAQCDEDDTKVSRTLETFRRKVLEFARESKMSPEHILLIERSFPDFFPDLHVPDHPPYAAMIHRAITGLDEAGGSTEEAISLFIKKEQNDLPWAHATLLTHHLQKLCDSGDVVVTGEKSYMLNAASVTCKQVEAFDPNQIVAFNLDQIRASPIPTYSPCSSPTSSSSSSYSDYTPDAKRRKQKRTGRKYGKKRRSDRKKPESGEEIEKNEGEHSEETEEGEEFEEYEAFEEFHKSEEEVEVTEVKNGFIKSEVKHPHRTGGAEKRKTEGHSQSRDVHMRVIPDKNQVDGMQNREIKVGKRRGRPPKWSKTKTYIGPKEAQVELTKTYNQGAEVADRLKQKRRRGRPSKKIVFETENKPEEMQDQFLETYDQLKGVLNRPNQSRERSSPPEEIGTDTDFGPKEVHKEETKVFNQATGDLKGPREKRGRGRPPKNSGDETITGQKEVQGEVIESHNQTDCMKRPKQTRGRGRPPKNTGGKMVVFEVHNQTTEEGMKVKQGRRRFRRKHDKKEVDTYLDQLELTVLQDMFGRMKIQSCDDGEKLDGAVSPSLPCKSSEPVMEDKIRKEREQQIEKHDLTKLPERSQELGDMKLLFWTPNQLPQEGAEDEAYPCQLHLQACKSKTDHYATTKEIAPSVVVHEEQQQECVYQGGPPGFDHVTTITPLTLSNYQHEDVQQEILVEKKLLLDTEEETSTFMELLQSEYQYITDDKQLNHPKKQGSGCSVSTGQK